MNYLIDGFNLAFVIDKISSVLKDGDTDKAIHQLIHYVRSKLGKKRNKIIIVFDGQADNQPKKLKQGSVEILFSKSPQTADDIIRNLIRKINNKDDWTVVSSDNEIIYTAKDHGVKILKSESFIHMHNHTFSNNFFQTEEIKRNPDNIDIEYWRKIFNSGKNND